MNLPIHPTPHFPLLVSTHFSLQTYVSLFLFLAFSILVRPASSSLQLPPQGLSYSAPSSLPIYFLWVSFIVSPLPLPPYVKMYYEA